MSRLVLEHYPASKLPSDLRAGVPADAIVRITIEEERRKPFSAEELLQQLKKARQKLPRDVTAEEAADRIRQLRDEWDD